MKLKIYDKKEDVPAKFADVYEETDGKWSPKQELVDLLEEDGDASEPADAGGLKKALEAERKLREKAEKDLRAQKQQAADKERQNKGVTEEVLKTIRQEVRAELEEEFAPIKTELETAKKSMRELQLDSAVQGIMGSKDVGVRSERTKDLWRLVKDEFDLTDDGKPMVKDKPGTEVGKYLADAVKKRYPEFFQASAASGGGAAGAGGTGTKPTPPAKGTPTVEDILKNPGAAIQAARASGNTGE